MYIHPPAQQLLIIVPGGVRDLAAWQIVVPEKKGYGWG